MRLLNIYILCGVYYVSHECVYSALHIAAGCGSACITLLLLINGASPHTQTTYGDTPLHYAVEHDNVVAVELLMHFGARRSVPNSIGETPLSMAQTSLSHSTGTSKKSAAVIMGTKPLTPLHVLLLTWCSFETSLF